MVSASPANDASNSGLCTDPLDDACCCLCASGLPTVLAAGSSGFAWLISAALTAPGTADGADGCCCAMLTAVVVDMEEAGCELGTLGAD